MLIGFTDKKVKLKKEEELAKEESEIKPVKIAKISLILNL